MESVAPQEKNKYTLPAIKLSFRSKSPKLIKLIMVHGENKNEQTSQCLISDTYKSGCNIPVSIAADLSITCTCDSYSDFN